MASRLSASVAIRTPRAGEMSLRASHEYEGVWFLTICDTAWFSLGGMVALSDLLSEAEAMDRLAGLAAEAARILREQHARQAAATAVSAR